MKDKRLAYFLFPLMLCCSCQVTNLEMPITDLQKQGKDKSNLKEITVGLVRPKESRTYEYQGQDYTIRRYENESFLKTLKQLNIFGDVDYYDKLSRAPDLVINESANLHQRLYTPWKLHYLLFPLSLGIIPLYESEKEGFLFWLMNPDNEEDVKINFAWTDHTITGWLALFLAPWEAWTLQSPYILKDDYMKAQILAKTDEIYKLAKSPKKEFKKDQSLIVGTWTGRSDTGDNISIEFNSDKSVVWIGKEEDAKYVFKAKYKVDYAADPISINIYDFDAPERKPYIFKGIAEFRGRLFMRLLGRVTNKNNDNRPDGFALPPLPLSEKSLVLTRVE